MPGSSTARGRLIDSARRLLHSSNYASVSVDDLCADAAVRKGSFSRFFPSKRDLALTALDNQWDAARETILDPAFAWDVPPLERFRPFSASSPTASDGTRAWLSVRQPGRGSGSG